MHRQLGGREATQPCISMVTGRLVIKVVGDSSGGLAAHHVTGRFMVNPDDGFGGASSPTSLRPYRMPLFRRIGFNGGVNDSVHVECETSDCAGGPGLSDDAASRFKPCFGGTWSPHNIFQR